MFKYQYQGVDENGRNVTGEMTVADEAVLEERLKAMGLWLLEARVAEQTDTRKRRRSGLSLGGPPGKRELIDFCTLMTFQLRAGVPMVQSLDVAASDCPTPRFREALYELRRLVEAGESLADAMAHSPKAFPSYVTSLIRAAETSGRVPDAFEELAKYLEWQEQIVSEVRQATLYPTIVLTIVCLFVFVLFTFVVPKFVSLLAMAKVGLPLITKVVFAISGIFRSTWWIWLLLGIGAPAVLAISRAHSSRFAEALDRAKFRMPIFGPLIHMLVISRLAHNLAVLYRSGISLIQALQLCRDLVGSLVVSAALVDVGDRIEAGEPLSDSFRRHPVFPPLLIRMVAMGERTGTLDHALENVSTYYDAIIPRIIKKVFGILEPALIIFLVMIVGTVALAIFLPILQLMSAVK